MDEAKVPKFIGALEKSGLLYRLDQLPATLSGLEFHTRFNTVLASWLTEAFAHPFWAAHDGRQGLEAALHRLAHRALSLHEERQPPHAALLRPRARKADQAAARQALRRGVEPLSLLHEVAESARLHGHADRRLGAAADDAGAVELHASGGARGHPGLLDLLGGARGHHDRSRAPTTPTTRRRPSSTACPKRRSRPSTRTSISTSSISTRICSSRSCSTCRRCRPSAPRKVLDYGHQLVEHIWMWTDNIEKYYQDESNPDAAASLRRV